MVNLNIMDNKSYNELDKVYLQIKEFLNNYTKSTILQSFSLNVLESFFYANLINNFFINLNRKKIREYNLPRRNIGIIKKNINNYRKI